MARFMNVAQLATVMGGSMSGVLIDMKATTRPYETFPPIPPVHFRKKIFPVYFPMRSSRKALLKQRIKSVRLDLDIASSYLDKRELKALEDLYMDLHFELWRRQ